MKVSLNWAQHYSNVDLLAIPTTDLVTKIGEQLGAVEEVIEWGPRFDGILVVKVVSCEAHPNADKLHVCLIDDGKVVTGLERDQNGYVQVVCGAPNVKEGITVAWLPPGSTVPSTLEKDPFVLEARELRGVVSNGMLASPAELGLSDDHSGILEISPEEVGADNALPGTPFKKLYGLDDVVIDCENKMFTHRPDCFGILGVARELAGITQQKFISPEWYTHVPVFKKAHDATLDIKVSTELVPRFMAVVMNNVNVAKSPMWVQAGLTRVGIRPINAVVDITNWMMQLTGQPLHAYDYDKVLARSNGSAKLEARLSKSGEKIHLLNGKTVELDDATVVIATDKEVVGIGGVMGGADTEVDETTKNIILEVASFDMYKIRKTAMKYGLFTDAVTRFNKGQSPLQNDRVLAEAMRMVNELCRGHQASNVIDYLAPSVLPLPSVEVSAAFINARLGSSLTADEMRTLLDSVECGGTLSSSNESRSFLKGVGEIDDKLERLGIKIAGKTDLGYQLIIPLGKEDEYEKLVSWEMKPGFWNEYIGAKNVFLFKDMDTKVSRYEVSDENEHEIVEMCRTFANDYYTSIEALLATNDWYKPHLPLKKSHTNDATDPDLLVISTPFWRCDLSVPEDIVEEVGRLYGFSKLPVKLPQRTASPAIKNQQFEFAQNVRTILASAGANELLTYSFVHGKLLDAADQKVEEAYHIRNAISPDLQYYRVSLTPSLLDKVTMNIRAGYQKLALFEIGLLHSKQDIDNDGLPLEAQMLALTIAAKHANAASGSPYYGARAYLDFMAHKLGVSFRYEPIINAPASAVLAPFALERSAYITIAGTEVKVGIVGEYTSKIRKALKLPAYSAGFELSLVELAEHVPNKSQYSPLSRFPVTQQDMTLEVQNKTQYSDVYDALASEVKEQQAEHGYMVKIEAGTIFVPEASDRKRLTFHIILSHPDRTLTTEETNKFIDEIAHRAASVCAAKRI